MIMPYFRRRDDIHEMLRTTAFLALVLVLVLLVAVTARWLA